MCDFSHAFEIRFDLLHATLPHDTTLCNLSWSWWNQLLKIICRHCIHWSDQELENWHRVLFSHLSPSSNSQSLNSTRSKLTMKATPFLLFCLSRFRLDIFSKQYTVEKLLYTHLHSLIWICESTLPCEYLWLADIKNKSSQVTLIILE